MAAGNGRLPAGAGSSAAGLMLGALMIASPAAADAPGVADGSRRIALEFGGEAFRWQERDAAGRRLLGEHGLRWTLGASVDNFHRRAPGPLWDLGARGYLGRVEYDGQDTGRRFVATTTSYTGIAAELVGGWRLSGAPVTVDLLGGVGVEHWRRDIRGASNAEGLRVAGFIEDYTITFGRVGLGLTHEAMPSGYLTVGYRIPFHTREDIVIDRESIELEPGRNPSVFVAWRIALRGAAEREASRRYLRVYYETWRFDRSPSVPVGNLSVWQPESDMDVLGVVFGLAY